MKEITPQYKPSGKEVKLTDCYNSQKVDELIKKIESSNISEEEKKFLKISATRHYIFNYNKIADYYANASKQMQQLMEESALVIIDVNDAIKNGFAELNEKINKLMEE